MDTFCEFLKLLLTYIYSPIPFQFLPSEVLSKFFLSNFLVPIGEIVYSTFLAYKRHSLDSALLWIVKIGVEVCFFAHVLLVQTFREVSFTLLFHIDALSVLAFTTDFWGFPNFELLTFTVVQRLHAATEPPLSSEIIHQALRLLQSIFEPVADPDEFSLAFFHQLFGN